MSSPRLKLITFDLDDTLWEVTPVLIEAEAALHRFLEQQLPYLGDYLRSGAMRQQRAALLAAEPALMHRVSQLRLQVIEAVLLTHGIEPERAQSLAQAAFEQFLQARHQVRYYPDALAILELLAQNYRLGALTNGNADIRRLGLDRYFDFGFSAEMLGASKPDPALFQAALEAAQCRPDQMVHVGDHHQHDVEGAQQLGIQTIWINHKAIDWPGGNRPGAIIHHLGELPDALIRFESARTGFSTDREGGEKYGDHRRQPLWQGRP